MELQQLKYFKAVADAGKISEAAKALYISPPALSATISRLERELDVKLFTRTNNRILLNKQGELLLHYVNQVLVTLNTMEIELQKSKQQEQQHIQVAVTYSNLWVGLICAFSLEYPQITLSYTTLKLSQLADTTEVSRYQFILAEENDIPGGLNMASQPLIDSDTPMLVVHPEHPLACRSAVTMQDIAEESLLLPVFDQSLHRMTCGLLDEAGIPHTSAMECSYMVRRSMVMNNRGVSFSTACSSKYEEPSFRYIPITGIHPQWRQKLFWHSGRSLTAEEKLFCTFAADYFKNTEAMTL